MSRHRTRVDGHATWQSLHTSQHSIMVAFREATAALSEAALGLVSKATAALWTEAVPEQQKLTIQLARNSLYFVTSYLLIRLFGDQLAV